MKKFNQLATKIVSASICMFALSTQAHADRLIGVYADANLWMHDGNLSISKNILEEELNFDYTNGFNVSIALEHFVPLVPNVRLRHGMIKTKTDKDISLFKVNNRSLTGKLNAEINVTHTDVLAYYQILDNIVSADIGLGAKIIDADLSVKNRLGTLSDKISPVIPMLYASAGGSLPLTGLSAKIDVAGIAYKENQLIDAQAEVKYNFIDMPLFDLGGKLGYRFLGFKTDELFNSNVDMSFKGPYAGLEAHF